MPYIHNSDTESLCSNSSNNIYEEPTDEEIKCMKKFHNFISSFFMNNNVQQIYCSKVEKEKTIKIHYKIELDLYMIEDVIIKRKNKYNKKRINENSLKNLNKRSKLNISSEFNKENDEQDKEKNYNISIINENQGKKILNEIDIIKNNTSFYNCKIYNDYIKKINILEQSYNKYIHNINNKLICYNYELNDNPLENNTSKINSTELNNEYKYINDNSSINSFSDEEIIYHEAPFVDQRYITKYIEYIIDELDTLKKIDSREDKINWINNINNSLDYLCYTPDKYCIFEEIPIENYLPLGYIDGEEDFLIKYKINNQNLLSYH